MPCFERQDSLKTLGSGLVLGEKADQDDFDLSKFFRCSTGEDFVERLPSLQHSFRKTPSVSTIGTTTTASSAAAASPLGQRQDPCPCTGAFIFGTGFASAKQKYTTEEMLEAFHRQRELQQPQENEVNGSTSAGCSCDKDFVERVFRGCGFESHSVALPKEKLFARLTREEYLEHRRTALKGLAQEACAQALAKWGGNPKDITHLFWGTMTGAMDSPTIDIRLAHSLGLNLDVKRTSIEGMGCLTGYRLLNLAREVVLGNPKARVLVVAADLRSALQNSFPKGLTRADVVSLALFRDAGSAVVIGGNPLPQEKALFEVMASKSRIVPDTFDIVDYHEMNDGAIRLNISIELRDIVAREEPEFVEDLFSEASAWQARRDGQLEKLPPLPDWDVALHTGGPRIIEGVCKAFGSSKQRFQSSWKVMKENGNLSGASNMAVLHHQAELEDQGAAWVLCLSMGPGVCLEGLVLRRV